MDVSEYHDTCCEVVLPLDGDVLMHVAPAVPEKEFPFDQAEVFLVPRGTLCCLRPGVWHHAPYALRDGRGELPRRAAGAHLQERLQGVSSSPDGAWHREGAMRNGVGDGAVHRAILRDILLHEGAIERR